jgi:signal transduction histidine kinase
MKLFTQYNRLNLLSTVVIFILASLAYYFLIRYVITDQVDYDLKIEKDEIQAYASKFSRLPEIIPVKEQVIVIKPAEGPASAVFETIASYDSIEKESIDFRNLRFRFKIHDQWYQALVGKSMEGTEHLIQSVVIVTVCTILLILAASFLINRVVLNKIWQPFYQSLNLMKRFKVGMRESFPFAETNIDEFAFMNRILQQATQKADQDFLILREFTENASHEMQTPLAIMRSKLDLLIQDEQISKVHENHLHAVYDAIQKLTRLNKSLLLLSKIENNQFSNVEPLDLSSKLQQKLTEFQEIIRSKSITISERLEPVNVIINPDLIDLLLNNLLSNSIKHNHDGGSVFVVLSADKRLIVSNTGSGNALDESRLFRRFYKQHQSNETTGLGLSILKQICIASSCEISYRFEDRLHHFIVQW